MSTKINFSRNIIDVDITSPQGGEGLLYNAVTGKWYNTTLSGVSVSGAGVTDHGELTGLDDDDHSQYLNIARHDTTTRHSLGSVVPHDDLANLGDVTLTTPVSGEILKYNGSDWVNDIPISGGVSDHGLLTGLEDDDHSQYLNNTRHDTVDRHTLGSVVPHDTFLGLSDTPSTYAGEAYKVPRIKVTEDGLEFVLVSGVGGIVGSGISGRLAYWDDVYSLTSDDGLSYSANQLTIGDGTTNGISFILLRSQRTAGTSSYIRFKDTNASPVYEWLIVTNTNDNFFIQHYDQTDWVTPVLIEKDAPGYSLYIDSGGNVSIGSDSNVAGLNLYRTGSAVLALVDEGGSDDASVRLRRGADDMWLVNESAGTFRVYQNYGEGGEHLLTTTEYSTNYTTFAIGVEDSEKGLLVLRGSATGQTWSGEVRMQIGADYDTTYTQIQLLSVNDDFRISFQKQSDSQWYPAMYLWNQGSDIWNMQVYGDIYRTSLTSHSPSYTGWVATPTRNCQYKRIGKTVHYWIRIYGTSNANTKTITLPYAVDLNMTNAYWVVATYDQNKAPVSGQYEFGIAYVADESSTLTIDYNGLGSNWSTTNQATVLGYICYETDD